MYARDLELTIDRSTKPLLVSVSRWQLSANMQGGFLLMLMYMSGVDLSRWWHCLS